MGELASEEEQRWVCPNDRQLNLRAKLNSGWSFHSSGPARKTGRKTDITDNEQEIIRNVLERADRIRQVEEERIGRLVEKLDNMRNNAIGDGRDTCLLCSSKFGTLKVVAKRCDICEKYVCQKCGLDTLDSDGDVIWLCMLCSEHRELWKRTGAWFFKAIPKYTYPEARSRVSSNRKDTTASNSSDISNYKYNSTWTSYSKSKDNLDDDIREESYSEEEESSSSSDEMLFEHSKEYTHSNRGRSSQDPVSFTNRRSAEMSMPGSSILESIDTPPPFRKRTLAMTQDEKQRRPSEISQNSSSLQTTNGQLSPDSSHTRAESPKREKSGSFTGSVNSTVPDRRDEVDGRAKPLVKTQDTEEEDIDELVRTFKESEAAVPKDTGDAGLGTIEFDVHYDKQHSQLQVTVICANGLKAMDSGGTSDPYVKLHLLPGASKSNKLRTHTKYKTLNPQFDETLVYHGITDDDISKKSLRLQIFDEDKLGRNSFIGETCVTLKIFHSKPLQSLKRSLVSRASFDDGRESPEPDLGRIQLSLNYKSQKNQLVVGVIRCAGLAAMDANGYSDPYVKCYLKPDVHKKSKRRTSVKKKTLNPEYNEEFVYEIAHHDLAKKCLELTVWDYDVGKSNDFIGGVVMDINSSGSSLMHWYDMLKTPNQVHTHWHTLEKLTNHEQE
ncbi:double C2-like domain-containing protein beta [Orbicella faveolata]|uniref:double C2-like domain-containing protein beta n=1 Tax=Orbicella faveolata TaxID=48498 RepID=UPI0009E553E1|nr:double C2-like domain-containing protein beta [Orbicella faveolata]